MLRSVFLLLSISSLIQSLEHENERQQGQKRRVWTTRSTKDHQQQRVLLISLDGFRHDYIGAYQLKNLAQLVRDGSSALYLNPEFCTESLPNHWSMVTGSHVEKHGIVGDKFYDPQMREHFHEDKDDLKWWNASEPIWAIAAK